MVHLLGSSRPISSAVKLEYKKVTELKYLPLDTRRTDEC